MVFKLSYFKAIAQHFSLQATGTNPNPSLLLYIKNISDKSKK